VKQWITSLQYGPTKRARLTRTGTLTLLATKVNQVDKFLVNYKANKGYPVNNTLFLDNSSTYLDNLKVGSSRVKFRVNKPYPVNNTLWASKVFLDSNTTLDNCKGSQTDSRKGWVVSLYFQDKAVSDRKVECLDSNQSPVNKDHKVD